MTQFSQSGARFSGLGARLQKVRVGRRCPRCGAELRWGDLGLHCCPGCSAKVYLSPGHRWLRGLASAVVVIFPSCWWFPVQSFTLTRLFLWLGVTGLYLALLFASFFVLPPAIEHVPADGPLRLDLY
jgi:hypothetical protein